MLMIWLHGVKIWWTSV